MANGNGDQFKITRATLIVMVAIGGPIAGFAVGAYQFREQVNMNAKQEATIARMDREAWEREREIKTLREDVDELMDRSRIRGHRQ